jgi:rhodanese-related sulfurtransferase
MKKLIGLISLLFIVITSNSYSDEYGFGVLQRDQNRNSEVSYTEKDVEELSRLGSLGIRSIMLPIINLMGTLQSVMQQAGGGTIGGMASANNSIQTMINELIAPALKLATGREVINIDAEKLYNIIQSGEKLQLIDVRTPAEYNQVRIPGVINIPMQDINKEIKDGKIVSNIPIVCICRTGGRSYMVAILMLTYDEFANTPIYNLEGGTMAWVNKDYPTEGK